MLKLWGCNKIYIGETCRPLNNGLKEQENYMKKNKFEKSEFCKHACLCKIRVYCILLNENTCVTDGYQWLRKLIVTTKLYSGVSHNIVLGFPSEVMGSLNVNDYITEMLYF